MYHRDTECIGWVPSDAKPQEISTGDLECLCYDWEPDYDQCECVEDSYYGCEHCNLGMNQNISSCHECDGVHPYDEYCNACSPDDDEVRNPYNRTSYWYDQEGNTCFIMAATNVLAARCNFVHGEHTEEIEQIYEQVRDLFVKATDEYAPEGLYDYRGTNFLVAMRIVKRVYRSLGMVRKRANQTVLEIGKQYECAILELRSGSSGTADHYSAVVHSHGDSTKVSIVDGNSYFATSSYCEHCGEICYAHTKIRDIWVFADDEIFTEE